MAKIYARRRRTALSLMASGVAKINIEQRPVRTRVLSIKTALRHDQNAIRTDVRNAYRKRENVLETV